MKCNHGAFHLELNCTYFVLSTHKVETVNIGLSRWLLFFEIVEEGLVLETKVDLSSGIYLKPYISRFGQKYKLHRLGGSTHRNKLRNIINSHFTILTPSARLCIDSSGSSCSCCQPSDELACSIKCEESSSSDHFTCDVQNVAGGIKSQASSSDNNFSHGINNVAVHIDSQASSSSDHFTSGIENVAGCVKGKSNSW